MGPERPDRRVVGPLFPLVFGPAVGRLRGSGASSERNINGDVDSNRVLTWPFATRTGPREFEIDEGAALSVCGDCAKIDRAVFCK